MLMAISLFGGTASGQVPPSARTGPAADSTELIIRKIRKEFSRINSDSAKYRVVSQNTFEESSEGGEIVRYFDGKQLIKMVGTFYGAIGNTVIEYYFRDGKLFFCYQQDRMYDKYMSGKVIKIEKSRFYLDNLKLIRWLKSNGKIADKALYPAKQQELLEQVTHLLSIKPEDP